MAEWEHGLCGCFDNCGLCIISYFCPCYQFGKNAEAVGDSCCCCAICWLIPFAGCIFHCSNRAKIREIRGIDGGCCGDAFYTLFCPFCAMVQEAQETLHILPGAAMVRE